LTVLLEPGSRIHVREIVIGDNFHRTIVAPLIRIADLLQGGFLLNQSLLLGLIAHPIQIVDFAHQRLADPAYQLVGALLALSRKSNVHVGLARASPRYRSADP